jgi:hypothetical protein
MFSSQNAKCSSGKGLALCMNGFLALIIGEAMPTPCSMCRQISGLWESQQLKWQKGNHHMLIFTL